MGIWFWRIGGTIAASAAIFACAPAAAQAAPGTPQVVSVTGIVDGSGTKTVLDILLAVPPGGDEQAAVAAALAARGAHAPGPGDLALVLQPFAVDGFTWAQFLDKGKSNNVVTQYYNPAGDPTAGAALGAILNAEATWSAVRSSSFRLSYAGETTRGFAFDGVNTISWGPLFRGELGVTSTTFFLATGAIVDSDVQLLANPEDVFPGGGGGGGGGPPPPPALSWRSDGGDFDLETVLLGSRSSRAPSRPRREAAGSAAAWSAGSR